MTVHWLSFTREFLISHQSQRDHIQDLNTPPSLDHGYSPCCTLLQKTPRNNAYNYVPESHPIYRVSTSGLLLRHTTHKRSNACFLYSSNIA